MLISTYHVIYLLLVFYISCITSPIFCSKFTVDVACSSALLRNEILACPISIHVQYYCQYIQRPSLCHYCMQLLHPLHSGRHMYFSHLHRLWNSLPGPSMDLNLFFFLSHPCTSHFLSPCSHCMPTCPCLLLCNFVSPSRAASVVVPFSLFHLICVHVLYCSESTIN